MHIDRRIVYKHLNHIVKILAFCPILIGMAKLTGEAYQAKWLSMQLLLGIEAGYLGFFQIAFKNIMQKKFGKKLILLQDLLIIIGYIVAIVIIFMSVGKVMQSVIQYKILAWVFYGVMFLIPIWDYQKVYYQIISIEDLVISTIIYIVAISCTKISYLGLMYIFIFGMYIFNKNQRCIEYLLEQTEANTPMAKNIKRDNVKWVCLLMSLILIVYPLRKKIAAGIEWMISWIGRFLLAIIRGIIGFLNMIIGGEESIPQEPVPMGSVDLAPMAQGNGNLDKVLYVLVSAILLFLIIKKRREILVWIKGSISSINHMLRSFIRKLFGNSIKDNIPVSNKYYMETVESIDDDMLEEVTRQKEIDKRKWKRQVKKYLRQASSDLSYRRGYELVLQGVSVKGIKIRDSKTPREILEIMKKETTLSNLTEGTYIYEKIRYDEQTTTKEEVEIIVTILKELLMQ